jgi:hypothetical protein
MMQLSGMASRTRVCAPERPPFPLPLTVFAVKQDHYGINQFYLGIRKVRRGAIGGLGAGGPLRVESRSPTPALALAPDPV